MLATLLLSVVSSPQDRPNPLPAPAAGIAVDLARERAAAISDLHYSLAFAVSSPVTQVTGDAELTFVLAADAAAKPLVLDFDGEVRGAMTVNGTAVAVDQQADHIVVPASALRAGENTVRLRVASAVAAAGTPLTVYRDPSDASEYCYTLVVPADAHRLYPCFDQPDLKATFALELRIPAPWSAIGNGTATVVGSADGTRTWSFTTTRPLPTYLMAFACGPFASVASALPAIPGIAAGSTMRTWFRPGERERVDVPTLARMHGEGLRWLCEYFAEPYPFEKLDIVLLPGFPYGGMEHAGAVFYREKALSFDHEPTASELVRRSTLVYHELAHQWFGNLVTMRWFDDLWLKEGFATFVAYRALEQLEPERRSWLRFLQRVKPRAYEVDATPGTTPVFQALGNLADAKSAYGAIVYNKAPAVLRELEDRLGAARFRDGIRRFLRAHRFGNATWQDLASSLETAAEADLARWSERWLLGASLPRVRIAWQEDADGRVVAAELQQAAVEGAGTWPLRVELLVFADDGSTSRCVVASDAPTARIDALLGRRDVACLIANPGDIAYGQFLPDPVSSAWLVANLGKVTDPLLRAVAIAALFESVREAELAPLAFVDLVAAQIADEADADTHSWLLDLAGTCLSRYVADAAAAPVRDRIGSDLVRRLKYGELRGRELQTFRFLAHHGSGGDVAALCHAVMRGEQLPAGLAPGREDRFLAWASLLGAGGGTIGVDTERAEAAADLRDSVAKLLADFAGSDLGRDRFLALAAAADPAAKESYFAQYLAADGPPEQWAQDSLMWFHWRGQSDLTRPFLRRALEQAAWLKANRRIFFMPAWLDAFVNGHADAGALAVVDEFLAATAIDPDVRRKLLQSRDGLARAVRIRARFPEGR